MPDTADPTGAYARPPAVDALLRDPACAPLLAEHGATATTAALRAAIDATRASREAADWRSAALLDAARDRLADRRLLRARRVFNLTGTTLHTNLGRAPLAESAIAAAVAAMRWPLALEYDVATGERGERDDLVEPLVRELTGAEAATVVNNNAAAVMLVLDTLAGHGTRGTRGMRKREAIVSRGELVEIGGAFRVPDIMRRAGCRLVEVGTTNRTHASDYRDAIGPDTALVMRVHASNYRIEGFVAMPSEREVADIARTAGVPSLVDLGAGALVDLAAYGLPHEPTVAETIASGVDLVTFSGDKLLGGPQCGIVAGRAALIERLRRNPLRRALRCDKTTLAALEATLVLYREPERLTERLTTLRWLTRTRPSIRATAERLLPSFVERLVGVATVTIEDCASQIGSGAQPVDLLPSTALVIRPLAMKRAGRALQAIEAAARALPMPVVGRIAKGALWLDLRTVDDAAADTLAESWASLQVERPT